MLIFYFQSDLVNALNNQMIWKRAHNVSKVTCSMYYVFIDIGHTNKMNWSQKFSLHLQMFVVWVFFFFALIGNVHIAPHFGNTLCSSHYSRSFGQLVLHNIGSKTSKSKLMWNKSPVAWNREHKFKFQIPNEQVVQMNKHLK